MHSFCNLLTTISPQIIEIPTKLLSSFPSVNILLPNSVAITFSITLKFFPASSTLVRVWKMCCSVVCTSVCYDIIRAGNVCVRPAEEDKGQFSN